MILNFRRLLERHELTKTIFAAVAEHLAAKGELRVDIQTDLADVLAHHKKVLAFYVPATREYRPD